MNLHSHEWFIVKYHWNLNCLYIELRCLTDTKEETCEEENSALRRRLSASAVEIERQVYGFSHFPDRTFLLEIHLFSLLIIDLRNCYFPETEMLSVISKTKSWLTTRCYLWCCLFVSFMLWHLYLLKSGKCRRQLERIKLLFISRLNGYYH